MSVRLHHEGNSLLIWMFITMLAINLPVWYLLHSHYIAIPITITVICVIIYSLAVNFFRSPHRIYEGDQKNVVVSSVDGEVVALEEVYEKEFLHRKVIQLSVFMTPFNVHANWYPVNGKVIYTAHHDGRFLSAYLPKSSTENERSTVVIETPEGQQILVRQIAGAMARRIVTYATVGETASIEDHFGFIKFGSRVDIFLPLGTEVFVKIGDKTTGGISTVARLHPEKSEQ